MNFLAHIYLSGNNKLLMVGNFIGDAVKGRKHELLHPTVRKGVLLHREIDDYTDRHPINAEVRKLLHPHFGKYAGVYLDIFYDHFLAVHWNLYSPNVSLKTFCVRFYFDIIFRHKHLPSKIKSMLPPIIMGDRIKGNIDFKKLQETFDIMSSFTSLPRNNSKKAVEFLKGNYAEIEEAFLEFFPQLILHTEPWRTEDSNENLSLPDLYLENKALI